MIGPIFIKGIPKGQPRVRAFVRGRHAGVYDPGTADDWKATVQLALRGKTPTMSEPGPCRVVMTFYFPRPKSHFTKKGKRPDAPVFHTSKPDTDNLQKAVLDVLTNLAVWCDDSQVACIQVQKLYAGPESFNESGVQLTVKAIQEQQA